MTGSNIAQNHAGGKPDVLGGVKCSTSSQGPKKTGWCQTPHNYFLELPRFLPALEFNLVVIILDRTVGCSKPRAWIRMSEFMQWTGKSERSIQPALTRLTEKTLIDIQGRKGGRSVVPSYAVDQDAIEAYILARKRAQVSVPKRAQVLREKRAQFSAGGIKDSLLPKDSQSSSVDCSGVECAAAEANANDDDDRSLKNLPPKAKPSPNGHCWVLSPEELHNCRVAIRQARVWWDAGTQPEPILPLPDTQITAEIAGFMRGPADFHAWLAHFRAMDKASKITSRSRGQYAFFRTDARNWNEGERDGPTPGKPPGNAAMAAGLDSWVSGGTTNAG